MQRLLLQPSIVTGSIRGMAKAKGKEKEPAAAAAPKAREEEKAVSVNGQGQIVLRVHAKPGAKISKVTDVGVAEVGVAIAAPPREGQANQELLDSIGKLLGLRKSELDFDKGAKSRSKVLLITSTRISLDQVIAKLKADAES